jgi:muramoyltetrapeptide carboxypeptidase
LSGSLARPRALRPGDKVAVLCVSSPVDPGQLETGLDVLRFAGLDPVTYPSALDTGSLRRYLAGDDTMRGGDLRAALLDPRIAAILFARGGSGSQRTLAAMDWTGLAEVAPKVLAGYSDVTAVLEAVAVRLGWASLFGPVSAGSQDAYSVTSLLRVLTRPADATMMTFARATTIVPGVARGVTMGGTGPARLVAWHCVVLAGPRRHPAHRRGRRRGLSR